MNIGMILVIILGVILGGFPTLYIALGMPALIIWKIYRRVTKKIPITD